MKILYVVNPTAGRGRAHKTWERLTRRYPDIADHVRVTNAPGEAECFAAAADGYDAVVAVGGDGTLHEVVNGVMRSESPVAVGHIPCGTGNDFARSIRLPKDPERAWQVCQRGHTVMIDVGMVNDRAFLNVAGFGFDAAVAQEVTERAETTKATGTIPYLAAVFKLLRTYRPRPLGLEIDGKQMTAPIFFGAIGNGSTYGGGMKICPGAECQDGLFHVCLAGDFSRAEALINLVRVFWGGHVNHRKCTYLTAREITVHGDPTVLVHADGQMIGSLPVSLRVIPRALKFICPDTSRSLER